MLGWLKQPSRLTFLAGLGLGLLFGVGMLVGSIAIQRDYSHRSVASNFPEQFLRAATADAGDSMAIATGPITEGIEGVFFLDFLTGSISGGVMNPKTMRPLGAFGYDSVYRDLGIRDTNKAPKLLMATGMTNVRSYTGGITLADSIVYICDTSTGNYACYGLPWNKAAINWNAFQPVPMVLLGTGSARAAKVRE